MNLSFPIFMFTITIVFLASFSEGLKAATTRHSRWIAMERTTFQGCRKLPILCMTNIDAPKMSSIPKDKNILMAPLSLLGASEMAYLTWAKLSSSEIAGLCTSESCNSVLSSPYSTIPLLDVPLSLIASVAYSIIFILSLPLQNNDKEISSESISNSTVLFVSTAMATFSSYLMLLLIFILHSQCNYCYLSAILSFSLAIISWNDRIVPNLTKAFTLATSSVAITAAFSFFLFYATGAVVTTEAAVASTAPAAQYLQSLEEANVVQVKAPPKVTNPSTQDSINLAQRLNKLDAKMYGAYWCSHCYNQKQDFGTEAVKLITYVECDKEGQNSQKPLCKTKKVFNRFVPFICYYCPTWYLIP